ncbi:TonB-dependent receptor [Sphingobium sp. GW456-12-10-14-TSB1]|uniref:TonB-dependent receptor n=1 Tax=Sphingobium sp. GW456-12-10-14-TSB1 TaxID=1987165 RepID=UPI00159330A1|nr:TonB-dependent receptor [Sphingobium sp. GW456-12-10-14-TSB1]
MGSRFRCVLLAAVAVGSLVPVSPALAAEERRIEYHMEAGDLGEALKTVSRLSGKEIIFSEAVLGKTAPRLQGSFSADEAVRLLLEGSGLVAQYRKDVIIIRGRSEPSGDLSDRSAVQNEIVVTGSRIRGTEPASPVVVSTKADIEMRGNTDLGSFARSLVQNYSGGQNPGIAASGQGGSENVTSSSALNLRGLGADATLTLFNGHRVAYDAISQGVDITAVPLAAIDRVEVVTDGSSALYGSDAVGGVANVILLRDYDGALITSRVGGATDGGDVEKQFNIVTGARWASGGLMTTFDYRHSTPITAGQRSYTQTNHPSETLLNGHEQYSAVVAGHQRLSDRVEFELDGQFSDRSNAICINFTTTDGCRVSGSDARASTRSWTIAPSLKVSVANSWQLRLVGMIGESNVQTVADTYYEDVFLDQARGRYNNQVRSLEMAGEGPLFRLPGGTARLALGGGLRNTKLIVNSIDLTGGTSTTIADFSVERETRFAFAEVSLPIIGESSGVPPIERLILTGAVRYEDIQGVGEVATPKLGVILAPARDLTVKFSWGKSFKAPTLYQSGQPRVGYSQNGTTDFFPGSPTPGSVLYLAGGNPNLRPERATNWTATVSVTPSVVPQLRIDASYFHIKYRDRVVTPIPSSYSVAFDPRYSNYVLTNPTRQQVLDAISGVPIVYDVGGGDIENGNAVAIITNYLQNAARQTIDGVDIAANYTISLDTGNTFRVTSSASYLRSEQQLTSQQPVVDLAGTIFRPPHWRSISSIEWDRPEFSLSSTFTYIGGSTDGRIQPTTKVGSYKSVDVVAKVTSLENSGPLKGFSATLSLLNIFNEKPPYIRTTSAIGYHYDSTNFPTVGRFISLAISKTF